MTPAPLVLFQPWVINCLADNTAGAAARPPIADTNKDNRRGRKGPYPDIHGWRRKRPVILTPSRMVSPSSVIFAAPAASSSACTA